MAFSKTFPRTIEGSNFPKWEEVFLTEKEETDIEENARKENISMMKQCLEDAKRIMHEKSLKDYQTDLVRIAVALFEKMASHSVYWKENLCKDKFDKIK